MHVENVDISCSQLLQTRLDRCAEGLVAVTRVIHLDRDRIIPTLIIRGVLGGNH